MRRARSVIAGWRQPHPLRRRDPRLACWVSQLGTPRPEAPWSRRRAHVGGVVALVAVVGYLVWRATCTLPASGVPLVAGSTLLTFEALPLLGIVLKLAALWNIDSPVPPEGEAPPLTVVVLIPTYNEPVEVIAPTIAASVALSPEHDTWVLDDGDRPWVAELCGTLGARYVCRPVHDHAKAGNLNHAFGLMAAEAAAGAPEVDVIAVLDCDHVPLEGFLTATLGWFADPRIALVQAPQAFYNTGAFDDDGRTGEQGLFFNVQMRARRHPDAGPFWCGSTSLLRLRALTEVGGVATDTITEDMHTTLKLLRAGWRTVFHHQTLAVGLAPETAEQYLVQRRRWGLGCMQVLVHERLWAARRWLNWRNYYEYLTGTLWWLEGVATLIAFAVPTVLLLTGERTSTADPRTFAAVFSAMFVVRLWGSHQLMRGEIHWPTALALRVFRIPIGCACAWWLMTRRVLRFEVTPKSGAEVRARGTVPAVLRAFGAAVVGLLVYSGLGVAGVVPWRSDVDSTIAGGSWLLIGTAVIALGVYRICSDLFASSRRAAHRFPVTAPVLIDGYPAELVDLSMGGALVRVLPGEAPQIGLVELTLPGAEPIKTSMPREALSRPGYDLLSLQLGERDWTAMHQVALWLFHTPAGVLPDLPPGVPAAAVRAG